MSDPLDFPTIAECPYLPPGFVALQDRAGYTVLDCNTGNVIRIPVELPWRDMTIPDWFDDFLDCR